MTQVADRAAHPSRRRSPLGGSAPLPTLLSVLVVVVVAAARATGSSGSSASPITHLAAVAAAVVLYVVARRWGVWRWLAAVAAAPILLQPAIDAGRIPPPTTGLGLLGLCLLVAIVLWRAAPPRRALLGGLGTLAAGVALGALVGRAGDDLPGPVRVLTTTTLPGVVSGALLIAVVVACAAVLGLARAGPSRMRGATAAATLLPCAVAAGAAPRPGTEGSEMVEMAVLAFWPLAGALGLTALLRGRRGPAASRPQLDEVDRRALDDFDRRYATPRLAPVAVVIAAYDEERGLPAVLAALPDTVCGLPADVVVVDDGSTDGTAAAVERDPRAHLVRCGRNRGQGAALRLGYRVARDHGARYVVTTDADGQYDTGDLPTVLAPVLEGRADFVTGSRRLGRAHTFDRVRRTGVHVFAGLVSALVGQRVTDTSFGMRAMRAEVTAEVTLNQVQYQSSELLIGAFSHGYRVLEVPATMHLRTAGASKKGRNLVYGRRYAGVVLGTWWREGCPRPAPETAPALRRPASGGSGAATTA